MAFFTVCKYLCFFLVKLLLRSNQFSEWIFEEIWKGKETLVHVLGEHIFKLINQIYVKECHDWPWQKLFTVGFRWLRNGLISFSGDGDHANASTQYLLSHSAGCACRLESMQCAVHALFMMWIVKYYYHYRFWSEMSPQQAFDHLTGWPIQSAGFEQQAFTWWYLSSLRQLFQYVRAH